MRNLKTFLSLLALLILPLLTSAQPPADTLGIEALTDSTFVIWLGEQNQKNDRLNKRYVDNVFDSLGVIQFTFNQIRKNEFRQWEADMVKLQAEAVTKLYKPVNKILNDFGGVGYLATSFKVFSPQIIGYYRADYNEQVVFLRLNPNGTAVQVNANGGEVSGGYSGTWSIFELNRFTLKDFFPVSILPVNSVFNRAADGGKKFKTLSSTLTLTKIR